LLDVASSRRVYAGRNVEKDEPLIHCLVLGDSIAVGVGMARPDCETVAKVGITSKAYVQTMLEPADAQTLIVSLGANDDGSVDTAENLRALRRAVRAQSVVWLLPGLKDPQRAIIRQVAASYGDRVIDTRPQAGPDHLHPTGAGYRYIAEETEQAGWDSDPVEVAEAEEPGFRAARQNARRLFALRAQRPASERTVAERMRIGRDDARRNLRTAAPRTQNSAASRTPATVAPKHAMVIHADDRTTLSDGSQCIRLDARVYCSVSPKIVPMIDPLRDHRSAAAPGAAAKAGRQALAN
jgi:hypothetical protein